LLLPPTQACALAHTAHRVGRCAKQEIDKAERTFAPKLELARGIGALIGTASSDSPSLSAPPSPLRPLPPPLPPRRCPTQVGCGSAGSSAAVRRLPADFGGETSVRWSGDTGDNERDERGRVGRWMLQHGVDNMQQTACGATCNVQHRTARAPAHVAASGKLGLEVLHPRRGCAHRAGQLRARIQQIPATTVVHNVAASQLRSHQAG
jgi:hypothetical protein